MSVTIYTKEVFRDIANTLGEVDRRVLLWTNPNPSVPFDAQTVINNTDLSIYDALYVEMRPYTTRVPVLTYRVPIGTSEVEISMPRGEYLASRSIVTTTTSVSFTGGIYFPSYSNYSNRTADNYACIPERIYGVQFGASAGNNPSGGGTTNYANLLHKPSINGVTLVEGLVTEDLNLGDTAHQEITLADFNALTEEEKNDGTVYFITDGANNNIFLDDNTPIGMIAPYGGSNDPAYWLICDGRAISRTAYSELFAVIGTTYGVGDGSTTFNIPDLSGKVAVGSNINHALGTSGGSETVTLNTNQIPAHTHDTSTLVNTSGSTTSSAVDRGTYYGFGYGATNQLGSTGGGQAHDNMPPYTVTNYIIKASSALSAGQSQLDFFYPTGSYYETTDSNFNPNEQWGGSWQLTGTDIFSLDKQILWTNATPNVNFGETTISISNLSDYDEIEIIWTYAASNPTIIGGSFHIPVGYSGILSQVGGTAAYNSGVITTVTRMCTVNTNNIVIGRANLAYDGTTYNVGFDHNLIPYKIYGIKNLSHYKWHRVG